MLTQKTGAPRLTPSTRSGGAAEMSGRVLGIAADQPAKGGRLGINHLSCDLFDRQGIDLPGVFRRMIFALGGQRWRRSERDGIIHGASILTR